MCGEDECTMNDLHFIVLSIALLLTVTFVPLGIIAAIQYTVNTIGCNYTYGVSTFLFECSCSIPIELPSCEMIVKCLKSACSHPI